MSTETMSMETTPIETIIQSNKSFSWYVEFSHCQSDKGTLLKQKLTELIETKNNNAAKRSLKCIQAYDTLLSYQQLLKTVSVIQISDLKPQMIKVKNIFNYPPWRMLQLQLSPYISNILEETIQRVKWAQELAISNIKDVMEYYSTNHINDIVDDIINDDDGVDDDDDDDDYGHPVERSTRISKEIADVLMFNTVQVCGLEFVERVVKYIDMNNLRDPNDPRGVIPNYDLQSLLDRVDNRVDNRITCFNIFHYLFRHRSSKATDNLVLAETDPEIAAPIEARVRATYAEKKAKLTRLKNMMTSKR